MDCVERVYTECLKMCILNMASSAAYFFFMQVVNHAVPKPGALNPKSKTRTRVRGKGSMQLALPLRVVDMQGFELHGVKIHHRCA